MGLAQLLFYRVLTKRTDQVAGSLAGAVREARKRESCEIGGSGGSVRTLVVLLVAAGFPALAAGPVHVWEKQELTFTADRPAANPYTATTVWVDLTGPSLKKRVYGEGGPPPRFFNEGPVRSTTR